jgi:predicted transposase YdaD
MSGQASVLTVLLKNKIMEEAKLNLSRALAEETPSERTMQEVQ